ncbi:MAG: succinate dehydrogenase / fumarate reductase cytochrome b subunit [Arenicella sp.]|jgi:succinate dehydrogenase / fumarate reductase cytochrome b subunit
MSWLTNTLTSTIGRKVIMALSGLFLISFLAVHFSGNISLLFEDRTAFNQYTNFMTSFWLIRVLELGLVAGFAIHIFTAAVLTKKNSDARPTKYAYSKPEANSTWTSRNMGITGSLILAFLLLHLYQFWWAYKGIGEPLDGEYKDMYAVVYETLGNPVFMIIYVVTFLILAMHLAHGFESAFQTLGFRHPKYTPIIKNLGKAVAAIFPIGFAVIAVIVFLKANGYV